MINKNINVYNKIINYLNSNLFHNFEEAIDNLIEIQYLDDKYQYVNNDHDYYLPTNTGKRNLNN